MLTTLIVVLIFSILIIVHEFGHFIAAKKAGVRVEKFSLGFGPQLFKKKNQDTEYSVSAIPLGGYVKLSGDNLEEFKGENYEYFSKPVSRRFWIVFSGPLLNYLLGFIVFWAIFFMGYPTLTNKVGGLLDGFGAKDAGIEVGDQIIAIDGKKVENWEELQKIIYSQKDTLKADLSVLRQGKEYTIAVELKQKEIEGQLGQKENVGLLGITPEEEFIIVKHGFTESFFLSINKTLDLTSMTYKALWRMLSGKLSMRDSVTGPLGIFYITSKVARMGLIAVLHLVAILNISLAIFNLLPLPILDGGHILFLIVEKARGKTLSIKVERIINQIGLTLIVGFALFVTYNDFLNLFGEKITKLFAK